MSALKKIISTNFLYNAFFESLSRYFDNPDEYGADMPALLLEGLTRSKGPLSICFDEIVGAENLPLFSKILFEASLPSQETRALFSEKLLPSFNLNDYSESVQLWAMENPDSLDSELPYIRHCTETLLSRTRFFNQEKYLEVQRSRVTSPAVIEHLSRICLSPDMPEVPRILNIGCGSSTEAADLSAAVFAHKAPVFFNMDIQSSRVNASNRILNSYDIPNTSMVLDARDYSNTEGLTSALMPNPDIVLVRHFQNGTYPDYPYAGLRSLSGPNARALVTFYFSSEQDDFLTALATDFIPESVPKHTIHYEGTMETRREYIVELYDFPEGDTFVYKRDPFHS